MIPADASQPIRLRAYCLEQALSRSATNVPIADLITQATEIEAYLKAADVQAVAETTT